MALFGLSFDKDRAKRLTKEAAAKGGAVLKAGAKAGVNAAETAIERAKYKIEMKREEKRQLNKVYQEELYKQKVIDARRRARTDAKNGTNPLQKLRALAGTSTGDRMRRNVFDTQAGKQKDPYGLFGGGKKKKWF